MRLFDRLPEVIQGGMGVGISNWRLAHAVSSAGQLGVVSGTALDQILARRLQDGDPGGHMRRGLARFPVPAMAAEIWNTYFIAGGKPAAQSYKTVPMATVEGPRELQTLTMVLAVLTARLIYHLKHRSPYRSDENERLKVR